jgi:hypothetical protein
VFGSQAVNSLATRNRASAISLASMKSTELDHPGQVGDWPLATR